MKRINDLKDTIKNKGIWFYHICILKILVHCVGTIHFWGTKENFAELIDMRCQKSKWEELNERLQMFC